MPLPVTTVNRNLQTRVTFMYLEFEDLFIVLGAAAVMNVVGRFVGGHIAGMPTNLVLQYGVPILVVPCLMLFTFSHRRRVGRRSQCRDLCGSTSFQTERGLFRLGSLPLSLRRCLGGSGRTKATKHQSPVAGMGYTGRMDSGRAPEASRVQHRKLRLNGA